MASQTKNWTSSSTTISSTDLDRTARMRVRKLEAAES
jgi:hypothetical protein